MVLVEIDKLAIMLKNRLDERKNEARREEIKEREPINVKEILFRVLKNQRKLAERQLKLAESQRYTTKLLYYSLEVMKRVLYSINNKKEFNHAPEIDSKIIEYVKSRINLR